MSARQRMNELLNKVQQGTASPEDYSALRELLAADPSGELLAIVHEFHNREAVTLPYDEAAWSQAVQNILQVDKREQPVQRVGIVRRRYWYAAAAAVVLAVAGTLWFNATKTKLPEVAVAPIKEAPILPGKNGAQLTLADGSTIVLDSMPNGVVAVQGNSTAHLKDGLLQYGNDKVVATTISWNTLRTPRGSQYQVVLADGTKVWLNAASSLRFPTEFAGAVREVEISGEAYFEVAKMAGKPFHVKTNNSKIEVLGTHFNVNAYEEEGEVRTTLLEGSVKVRSEVRGLKSENTVILKPGEQVSISHSSQLSQPIPVLTEQVIAWKNGFFHFDGASLEQVMRQLSRWYDVDVQYEGHPDNSSFNGKMGRDLKLAQVLNILQKSEVHLQTRIQERKIIVMP